MCVCANAVCHLTHSQGLRWLTTEAAIDEAVCFALLLILDQQRVLALHSAQVQRQVQPWRHMAAAAPLARPEACARTSKMRVASRTPVKPSLTL